MSRSLLNLRTRTVRRFLACALLVGLSSGTASEAAEESRGRLPVFVTILPQVEFAERIGGERVEVSAMVEPGRSPETFEPSPQQLARLSRAALYFRIGIGFEEAWLDKIRQIHPDLRIVDTRAGLALLSSGHAHAGEEHGMDPHVWLDPGRVRILAGNMARALEEADPESAALYRTNLARFIEDLDRVDAELRELFRDAPGKRFIVWHPAWGYLADAYGLEQVAVEEEGKEPNAKRLTELLGACREAGFRILFAPEETRTRSLESFARAANLRIVRLDPLAKNYLDNLRSMAARIREGLR
ncbi:MAG: zinc ABC transporter substrate-binding protein [bacterium]